MVLSSDNNVHKKILREPDPDLLGGWKTENKTVVFIRHGEVRLIYVVLAVCSVRA